jgi:curli biogenesis system outer membrane secretion channel CsgG
MGFPRGYVSVLLGVLLNVIVISACLSRPNAYVRDHYDASGVQKVGLFSFHNNTKIPEAGDMVTGAFLAGLVEGGRFQVEFPGNIRSFLVSERIIVRTGLDLDTIKLMGKRLGVDAVVLGQVEEYAGAEDERRGMVPTVSISARMVDAQTGEILWMAQYRRTGDDYIKVLDFGKIRSVGELTNKVVGEMIETIPK